MKTCASVRDCTASGKSDGSPRRALTHLPRRIALPDPAVEAWLLRLDVSALHLQQCALLMSRDEHARAARFHFQRDRSRYTVARAMLRVLLGNHLGLPPAALALSQAANGKPCLADPPVPVRFNLAHSGDIAIYAICRDGEPGVDVEQLDRTVAYDRLAQKFFSARELAELQRIPVASRKFAFLSCWTRKEAVVKATGDGLRTPLCEVEVTVAPDAQPRLLRIPNGNAADWTLYALDAGSTCTATLALRRTP